MLCPREGVLSLAEVVLPLFAVLQRLDDGRWLGELLLQPERSTLGARPERVVERLTERAARVLGREVSKEEVLDLARRAIAKEPVAERIELELPPRGRFPAWTTPVRLSIPAVRWSPGGRGTTVLEVPGLDLAVVHQGKDDELAKRAADEVRAALYRRAERALLRELVLLERRREVRIEPAPVQLELDPPPEKLQRRSILAEVGTDLTERELPTLFEREAELELLAGWLGGERPRSVLLVGPAGVGKTALVHGLVARREALGLGGRCFFATTGARLVAGQSGFGQWQDRCEKVRRDAARRRAILHLGPLLELSQVGTSEHQAEGVAAFLRPWLLRGDLVAVVECTPEQLSRLEQEQPHLLQAFQRMDLEPLSPERARRVLEARAAELERATSVLLGPAALDAVDRLHRRFATYSAHPAQALRFLEELVRDLPRGSTPGPGEVLAAFGRRTGLPRIVLDESRPLDLAALRDHFTARVSGQAEAIDLVVDLLARIKAGLHREGRPLASLLFAGPTGVGKTETAKALAAWLFGDERRLVRIDMSEMRDPLAARRLVGGLSGGEGVLTSAVRAQPFSVVLLDEVEKADPSCFDLLLQVLGEGRLTDARGRTAWFSNAVVIMTSNLGAGSHERGSVGFGEAGGASERFLEAVRGFFRPELVNRIDRVIAFAPLGKETVGRIARRELERLLSRPGLRQRGVGLRADDALAAWLAERGFDPRWGARHLQRALERELVVPLADELAATPPERRVEARAWLADDGVRVELRSVGSDQVEEQARTTVAGTANRAAGLRRRLQRLGRSPSAVGLRGEVARLTRLEEKEHRRRAKGKAGAFAPDVIEALARLPRLREVLAGMQRLQAQVEELEEMGQLALIEAGGAGELLELLEPAAIDPVEQAFHALLLDLYSLRFPKAGQVALGIYGEAPEWTLALARGYAETAAILGLACAASPVLTGTDPLTGQAGAVVSEPPLGWAMEPLEQLVGVVLSLEGKLVVPRFAGEAGGHVLRSQGKDQAALVHFSHEQVLAAPAPGSDRARALAGVRQHIAAGRLIEAIKTWRQTFGTGLKEAKDAIDLLRAGRPATYAPPPNVHRKGALGKEPRRRGYDQDAGRVQDVRLEKTWEWDRDLPAALRRGVEESLRREVEAQIVDDNP